VRCIHSHSSSSFILNNKANESKPVACSRSLCCSSCYELRVQEHVQRSQHQGNRAEQLDQYVERWTGGILEGITNGIANHTGLMRLALLTQDGGIGVEAINHLTSRIHAQVTCLDVLLRIVPGAAAVVQDGCN